MRWTLILDGKILRKRAHLTTSKGHIFDPDHKIKIQISDYIFESKLYPDVPFKGAVKVTYNCYFQVPKSLSKNEKVERLNGIWASEVRRDGDNIAKLYNDILQFGSLEGLIFIDDKYIVDLNVKKLYAEEEFIEIIIEDI